MKKYLIMLAAGLIFGILEGEAAVQLKLSLTDGSSKTFLLSEKPVIAFPGEQMTVTTPEVSFECDRTDVANMEFTEAPEAGIKDVQAAENLFSYLNDMIECPGSTIEVYDLGGMLRASGREVLSTSALASGIYIVRTNQHVVKIVKK